MLKNKICLVTGGNKGIGLAIVETLIKNNAKVIFTYLNDKKSANNAYEKWIKKSSSLYFYKMDVRKRESVKNVRKEIANSFGRIDVLVNNAGVNFPEDFDKITEQNWDDVMDVNLKGPFIVVQEFLKMLKKSSNGSIINIGSVSGQYGGPRTAHYAASKAGLISLSQVIARFTAKYNIRCNTLCAGLIKSEMSNQGLKSNIVTEASTNILLKRLGEKREVADVVAFLGSDKSSYITAQTINVNGGLYF